MPTTLLATQVPIPTVYSGFLRLADGENTTGNSPVAKRLATGDFGGTASSKLNRNGTQLDLTSRYGGGAYSVLYGLALGTGSGLNLAVGAGHASIDGIVEVPSNTTLTVPGSSARVHIWLQRDGTLTYVNNSLTPPVNPAAYLGSCVTGVSSITSVDDSGVLRLTSGLPVRSTADPMEPGDTPSASTMFLTKTLGGTYLWDGGRYLELVRVGTVPKIVKYTVGYAALAAAATTNNITLATIPAKAFVRSVVIKHSTSFSGGSISAYTVSVGITGNLTKYAGAFNVYQATGSTVFQLATTQGIETFGAATDLKIAATSTGANLNVASAGSVDVWVEYGVLP